MGSGQDRPLSTRYSRDPPAFAACPHAKTGNACENCVRGTDEDTICFDGVSTQHSEVAHSITQFLLNPILTVAKW